MLVAFVNFVDQIYVVVGLQQKTACNLNLRLSSSRMGSAEEGSVILAVVLVQVSVVIE